MPIAINGSGTLTGISVGGLPDGIVDADMLASNAVTAGKLASGVGGKILQQKFSKKTNGTSTTSTTIVETSSDFRITITPLSASSTIIVQAFLALGLNASQVVTLRLARNTASDFSGTTTEFLTPDTYSTDFHGNVVHFNANSFMDTVPLIGYETSGNTTARTYSPFWRTASSTLYLNQYTSTTYTMTSVMTVTEVAA
tara:strand:+ start:7346 stop:7939 length:594 start_codon:yes stop_codon:yes gene_type:complete